MQRSVAMLSMYDFHTCPTPHQTWAHSLPAQRPPSTALVEIILRCLVSNSTYALLRRICGDGCLQGTWMPYAGRTASCSASPPPCNWPRPLSDRGDAAGNMHGGIHNSMGMDGTRPLCSVTIRLARNSGHALRAPKNRHSVRHDTVSSLDESVVLHSSKQRARKRIPWCSV